MTTTTYTRQDCLALPYACSTEAKAEMFADALETVFLWGVEAEVFEDGGKWFVAIEKGMDRISDFIEDERITAVVLILMRFDLADDTGDIESIADGCMDKIPAANRELTRRARRAFRIEEKLDRILAKLDGA